MNGGGILLTICAGLVTGAVAGVIELRKLELREWFEALPRRLRGHLSE